ncbi:VOC family protein [Terricaulis sp.]|uniref:VOC family protein n=1 Tax=Terricaulis sp. TaxID=2768686 RepID=UPI003783B27F
MADFSRSKGLSSALSYKDPKAAFRWLEQAFGFEPFIVIIDGDGNLAHSEMKFGDSIVMVGTEWTEKHRSPQSIGGLNTQTVHVQLEEDIDAHCERARKAGASILQEPETQFYGDRTYRCTDPEGHIWTFGQTVKNVPPEDYEKSMGLKTQTRLD